MSHAMQDQCDFLDGIYNPNATVCSEVNCLEAKCGLSRFNNPDYPDQWYRFMTAVFLPVGALHFLLFALIQLMIGQSMEKVIGTWRFSLLWLISGTGGYIASAIFTPYQVRLEAASGPRIRKKLFYDLASLSRHLIGLLPSVNCLTRFSILSSPTD